MSDSSCSACGQPFPVASLYDLNDKAYCANCVKPALAAAKESGQPAVAIALIRKSLCARCNTYLSEGSPIAKIRHLRFCEACATLIKDWKYPQWLRFSFAALVLLLAGALVHGARYFSAGKSLYAGERLVEQGKYEEALPLLQSTIKVAPLSDKAVLLTAKAAILSGHPAIAAAAFQGHNKGYFEDSGKAQFQEVNALWNRVTEAGEDLEKARKLSEQDGNEVEAARLARDAAAKYPQLPNIGFAVDYYDSGVAFAQKRYDQFLEIAERDWQKDPSASNAAFLTSALDCKFATTGDPAFRARSEEMFAKAKQLASGDAEELKNLAEFEDRHNYRLTTREIITKSEYDRRFRKKQAAAAK